MAILFISLMMIPAAFTALEPIDIESYNIEREEIEAEVLVTEEFSSSTEVVGLAVNLRDPSYWDSSNVERFSDGSIDYTTLPQATEIMIYPEEGEGVISPAGGILNLTVLREIDRKQQIIWEEPISEFYSPMVDDVLGVQSDGVQSIAGHIRGFMSNESPLTQPSFDLFGEIVYPETNWSDCGELECLTFDDPNVTQNHIDLAVSRIAVRNDGRFMRWLSLDRTFVQDPTSAALGPLTGKFGENDFLIKGRWTASSTWILINIDKSKLFESGWTNIWKDSYQEKEIGLYEGHLQIGGYLLEGNEFETHPPYYNQSQCKKLADQGTPCSWDWSLVGLESRVRAEDQTTVTLMLGQAVNIEVNREMQSSIGLIVLMVVIITGFLWLSLKRITDVAIVLLALGLSLLWMQGLIGITDFLSNLIGIQIISRSQFSNLLPVLIIALGIDDSLHALHRYKEERKNGKSTRESAHQSVSKVGRAILLTSLTTIVAFGSNLISDIPALRSFGVEAGLGVFCAFVLTGLWVPLIRLSVDNLLEKKGKLGSPLDEKNFYSPKLLGSIASKAALPKISVAILLISLLITAPAVYGMKSLEGGFKIDDLLDPESDWAIGVNVINDRFSTEGEMSALLIEGDILDPRVFAGIHEFRLNTNEVGPGGEKGNKYALNADGTSSILGLDQIVMAAMSGMLSNETPFQIAGWNSSLENNGVNCPSLNLSDDEGVDFLLVRAPSDLVPTLQSVVLSGDFGGINIPDLRERGCLAFFYGYIYTYGVPATFRTPAIPNSVVELYLYPSLELNPQKPWLTVDGEEPIYPHTVMRFGIRTPEDLPGMNLFLSKEIYFDASPFLNLTSNGGERTSLDSALESEENPVSWVIANGKAVSRFVAMDSYQGQLQEAMLFGIFLVLIVLWIGFGSLRQSILTTIPIMFVVVWLYGIMYAMGGNLNLVTLTISSMSLGVGIDYCIHVTERYNEEKNKNPKNTSRANLRKVGSTSGLALVGSAVSDVMGFLIITLSPMGIFYQFGFYSASMIFLSLLASLLLIPAAIIISEYITKIGKTETY